MDKNDPHKLKPISPPTAILSGFFLWLLDVELQSRWLLAYCLSLVLFALTAIYLWLQIAVSFQYFGLYSSGSADLSSNKCKQRKAFTKMMADLVVAHIVGQNTLSDKMCGDEF